ncbi:MAG: type I-MYXAN CRISPR-associated Cas8a1/Cmx1 [Oscillatoriales cyanobacterium SM2_1_8]|nr:type I-MYXAN CRISPR-associated Cas8a1/Cmx1 [Oscillatoriales cyanobacterium SM2_1_8]
MTEITLSLFDPNTLLPHRAGIAGLALTLSTLSPVGAPLTWAVTESEVRLAWSGRDREAMTWLVRNTYRIEDGYLDVPALYLDTIGRYLFTQGVTSTLLQHGKQRRLDGQTLPLRFTIEPGQPEIEVSVRPLLQCYYTGDKMFEDAFTAQGDFKPAIALKGQHLPGLVECYVNGPYQESPTGFIALLFLPLACGYYKLPGPGLRSALVVPNVAHLTRWVASRRRLPERTYARFQSSGAGESGLRFLLQERAAGDAAIFQVDYCEVYQLGGQAWDTSQTYLKQGVYRVQATDAILALYEDALAFFPARVARNEKNGDTWLASSKALPWIADNLIAGKRWYEGFFEFQKIHQLYERQGLVNMTIHLHEEERLLFEAVQGAFRAFLREQGAQAQKQGRPLDYGQVTDKAIYRLQRPSTKQQFSAALVEFLSRFRSREARGQGLQISGWIHSDRHWRQARDLALLAIATYQSKSKAAENQIGEPGPIEPEPEGLEMDLV